MCGFACQTGICTRADFGSPQSNFLRGFLAAAQSSEATANTIGPASSQRVKRRPDAGPMLGRYHDGLKRRLFFWQVTWGHHQEVQTTHARLVILPPGLEWCIDWSVDCRAKPNGSICSLYKWGDTVFWFYRSGDWYKPVEVTVLTWRLLRCHTS